MYFLSSVDDVLFVLKIYKFITSTHRVVISNLGNLTPYVFQIRCCCRTTRILLSVLFIQLRHGLIISCPPPQDLPYYRMSMLREITFLQITYHFVSMLLLIMQLIVCIILVVTIITIICPPLTGMAPQIMIYTGTVCPPRVSYLSLVYHSMH